MTRWIYKLLVILLGSLIFGGGIFLILTSTKEISWTEIKYVPDGLHFYGQEVFKRHSSETLNTVQLTAGFLSVLCGIGVGIIGIKKQFRFSKNFNRLILISLIIVAASVSIIVLYNNFSKPGGIMFIDRNNQQNYIKLMDNKFQMHFEDQDYIGTYTAIEKGEFSIDIVFEVQEGKKITGEIVLGTLKVMDTVWDSKN